MKKVIAAVSGPSNRGKTTLLSALIAALVADGKRVGAIKHTHHAVTEESRGDTAAFLAAGARPVILAGDGVAVLFDDNGGTTRVAWSEPPDLVARFDTDFVLVEGFKSYDGWPRIEPGCSVAEARAILDRIAASP